MVYQGPDIILTQTLGERPAADTLLESAQVHAETIEEGCIPGQGVGLFALAIGAQLQGVFDIGDEASFSAIASLTTDTRGSQAVFLRGGLE